MNTVAVISASGKKLMPTNSYRARKLLKSGKAQIYQYRPIFTIQLLERKDGYTQSIEYACDTGYQHIGISIKSQKHEFVNEQRDLLKDETERHNDCRKYRSSRRNRKTRYRKPRFNNRKGLICKDGFAPSIRNKRNIHISLYRDYLSVLPITKAVFELGQFDTQVLKAVEEGKPLPEGKDYQQGERYVYSTLREAVFNRDNYTCQICQKSAIKNNVILKIHHLGYLIGDRSNRMSNLLTVCDGCHTSKNHKVGGKLYHLKPRLKTFKGATFMTMVRWDMLNKIQSISDGIDIIVTYGAATKLQRQALGISKSHSNDAYAMGDFQPKHRSNFKHYQKLRRNNRILSKFYDAKYLDTRDKIIKSGQQLSCGRTRRYELRNSDKNERIYRGHKVKKGRVSVRKQHYSYRPNDVVWYEGQKYTIKGVLSNGTRVRLVTNKDVSIKKVCLCYHVNGWQFIP